MDPIGAVRQLRHRDGIAVADPGLLAGRGQGVKGIGCKHGLHRPQQSFSLGLYILKGDCFRQCVPGGHGAAETEHSAAAAQRLPDIVAQRPQICSLGAAAAEQIVRLADLFQ